MIYRDPSSGAYSMIWRNIRSSVVDSEISDTSIFRATYRLLLNEMSNDDI